MGRCAGDASRVVRFLWTLTVGVQVIPVDPLLGSVVKRNTISV
jgi:hypothetical protein